MRRNFALGSVLVLFLAGCLSGTDKGTGPADDLDAGITKVRDRHLLPFNTSDVWSHPLREGLYDLLPVEEINVEFALPLGSGLPTATINMGVFRPNVPEGTKVPVIADVGPYYYDLDVGATEPAHRLGAFLIENFVPQGYAVAQVSVTGTGKSGGCMDLMGEIEQAGINAAVEFLGSQDWSNGNVGLIGRSYDGSTPWEAATFANPHLKTIVPISGLYGQYDLMWRNGSAELRGPGLLWYIYYTFALTAAEPGLEPILPWPPVDDPVGLLSLIPRPESLVPSPEYAPEHAQKLLEHAVCPDTQLGGAQAVLTYLTGSPVAPEVNTYWSERSFKEEALANYKGSVYFIHGLQDWNVDNHMAFPFYEEIQAKGLEVKGLFGQWGHMYPDRPSEHKTLPEGEGAEAYPASVRWDWAQDLLEWFDHYLKETGPQPELHAEVQDAEGRWRIEETYPPADKTWFEFQLDQELERELGDGLVLPQDSIITGSEQLVYASKPLGEDLRIAGMAQFHVDVTPMGSGGQLYAELRDQETGRRIAHAIMDLRYAEGGQQMQPVVPGMPLRANMEFFAADTLIPAGHALELMVTNTGRDYVQTATPAPVQVDGGTLRLPIVDRGEEAFFTPPASIPDAAGAAPQP